MNSFSFHTGSEQKHPWHSCPLHSAPCRPWLCWLHLLWIKHTLPERQLTTNNFMGIVFWLNWLLGWASAFGTCSPLDICILICFTAENDARNNQEFLLKGGMEQPGGWQVTQLPPCPQQILPWMGAHTRGFMKWHMSNWLKGNIQRPAAPLRAQGLQLAEC